MPAPLPAPTLLLVPVRIQLGGNHNSRLGGQIGSIVGLGLILLAAWLLVEPVLTLLGGEPLDDTSAVRLVGAVMAGFAGLAIRSGVKRRDRELARNAYVEEHDEPWAIRREWREGRIVHETPVPRIELFMGIVFGLGGLAMAAFVILDGLVRADDPEWATLLVLVFPAVGFFILGRARNSFRRRARFGESVLELETRPAWKGHHLAATLEARIPPRDVPDHGIRVQVSAYHRTARREKSGDRGSTLREHLRLLHREEAHMKVLRDRGDGLEIPVGFGLPEDVPSASPVKRSAAELARTGEHDILWRVEVHGDLPGLDYDATFEVPVFDLEEDTSPEARPAPPEPPGPDVPWRTHAIEPDLKEAASRHLELERPSPDRVRVRIRPTGLGTNFWVALGMGVVLLAITVPVLGQSILGGLIFGVFGVLCLAGAWTTLTHETAVVVEPGTLRIQTGRGGRKEVVHDLAELATVETRISGDENQSAYTVVLLREDTSDGEPEEGVGGLVLRIASTAGGEAGNLVRQGLGDIRRHLGRIDRIQDKHEADWIAEQIREAARAQGVEVG
ncbi:MAG: hypothetical protein EA352_05725 [Gemmatimonadales bacterium]|nr:MAG: hypothetical protein EA352_05725 [Gemmatimonadales bacterium]